MLKQENYAAASLELHLFFARIIKEHAFFLEAGFMPKNTDLIREADGYKVKFETLLSNAVSISDGLIAPEVLASGEIMTAFTLDSEQQSQSLTGIPINQCITMAEAKLHSGDGVSVTPETLQKVKTLNRDALALLTGVIAFTQKVLNAALFRDIFTANYPTLIEHTLHEAKFYHDSLESMEREDVDGLCRLKQQELFWDEIMLQHALLIRGLLDPSETDLTETANDFAHDYQQLLPNARAAMDAALSGITRTTLRETLEFRDFKETGLKGILSHEIRSMLLPLLADHLLREANHYIRLLQNA